MFVTASAIGYVGCLQHALYRDRALRLALAVVYNGTEEEDAAAF